MERLTKRIKYPDGGGTVDFANGRTEFLRDHAAGVRALFEKLAHYEDLEESGRLVVLPEGLKTEEMLKVIAENACPRWVGLADSKGTPVCDRGGENCPDCWQAALKGEKDG